VTVPVYYVTYIDPKTGFLKREDTEDHRTLQKRVAELVSQGVTILATGQYRRPGEE
jgi:hypothetical protein